MDSSNNYNWNRRSFLKTLSLASFYPLLAGAPALKINNRDLTITKITLQEARGMRPTPVAPNAYAEYRGREVSENVLRIQTDKGIEGVTELYADPQKKRSMLKQLLGKNPFDLYTWSGDWVTGPNPEHQQLVDQLYGADMALFDILGKVMNKPAADILGRRVRDSVPIYDSSLYMEDLLTEEQKQGLIYLNNGHPKNPADMVARKAEWIFRQPHGIRRLKVKVGRERWMNSMEEAVDRDIEVMQKLRETLGHEASLFVDGNNGYDPNPEAVKRFVDETANARIFAMEEMFTHKKVSEFKDLKNYILDKQIPMELTDGEVGGIPQDALEETVQGKPLFDINNPDMNWYGFLRMKNIAEKNHKLNVVIAPHNFGSKIGVITQTHMGMVTPNWRFSERDDTEIPAIINTGVVTYNGTTRLTGEPGLGIKMDESKLEKPIYTLKS